MDNNEIIEFKCKYCDNDKVYKHENDLMFYGICTECKAHVLIESKITPKVDINNIPKCPTCQSTNLSKIGTAERVGSIATIGIFSKKINKSYKCKNCGMTF